MALLKSVNLNDEPEIPDSKSFREDEVWVFSLKYEEEANVILLNDKGPPCVDAVEIWDGKKQLRCAVLASDGKDCPFTNLLEDTGNKKFRPKKFYVFTCLDLRGFTRKNGETVPYTRKALLVKEHMYAKWFRKRLVKTQDKQGTLRGSKWEVGRGPDMTPSPASCGDSWDFEEMVDLSEYTNTEVLTEEEILSLFVTDPDRLARIAKEQKELANASPATAAKY